VPDPLPPSPAQAGSSGRARRFWHHPVLPSLVLFALGLALYARTLGYEFLSWDDPAYVLDNAWIRELSWPNLIALFTRPVLESFFPLQSVSYMLDYQLWELDPFGYHLTSLLLNGLVAPLATVVPSLTPVLPCKPRPYRISCFLEPPRAHARDPEPGKVADGLRRFVIPLRSGDET